ncbi:MAG: flagellar hook-length control protein FliK [Brevundimonas sp.]
MSALTLLSVPTPAVPSAPQGSPAEVASGFQALLAAEAGEGAPAEAPPGAAPAPLKDEAKSELSGAPTVPTGPLIMPAPTPLVLPAAPTPPSAVDASDEAEGPDGENEGAGMARPDNAPPLMGTVDLDGPQTTTPLLVDKTPPAKTNDPQVQPRLTDVHLLQPVQGEGPLTLADDTAATEAVRPEARTGAAPVPAPPPMPVPPPLRALTERTSRPLDAPVAKTGDAARAGDPAPSATASVVPTASATAQPPRPVDAVAGPAADASTSEGATSDFIPSGDGAAAQADAPSVSREGALSQLSRVTIEATAQIAAQILRRLEGRSTRFEMALTPDELGRVDVKLDIDAEGRLNARLAFDNPAAATDLRGRADELRRQLEAAGFHLAEDAFEFAERDSGSSAFDRGQDARYGQSRAFTAAARLNAEIDVAQPPRWLALSLSPSGVDMKV